MSIIIGIILCVLVGGMLFRPAGISIIDDYLILRRPIAPIKIHKSRITSFEPTKPINMINTLNTFGIPGYMGYWGYYKNDQLGKFLMHTQSLKNTVAVYTGKKYVINCDADHLSELRSWLTKR